MTLAHHGAAHLHQRRPQRIERANVEFRCGVESSGGDGTRRCQHPVATHQLTGVVVADQQVIAVLVEPVAIPARIRGRRQCEAWRSAEHVIAEPLRRLDHAGIGG
ncbi:Uncharacterised protein [Mycobacterium tuberculosis]|uniref:Uncharacterized protein n=1 Tax=Mycobacterium tuberculosis TaxID=1773 RepID=A0A655JRR8_MYCTX|nr:Uncharacterised protein [Mycobacterium tuberculosis]COX24202.1 Uncharacterised protein [Mycobacterium tuberculosis]COX50198.1 Uncharacterised protein [Mycobacterium tuberculosis]